MSPTSVADIGSETGPAPDAPSLMNGYFGNPVSDDLSGITSPLIVHHHLNLAAYLTVLAERHYLVLLRPVQRLRAQVVGR